MAFSLGSSFNLHEQALMIQTRRAQLLAANLANADTPHYKAMDINFNQALQKAVSESLPTDTLRKTHQRHIASKRETAGAEALYRIPLQASLDGNTVESEKEMSAFNDNSIRYVTSLRFLSGKIETLMSAIRGE